jgi:hypothetical protein
MSNDPALASANHHLTLFALAVLLRGERSGLWKLEKAGWEGTEGQFKLQLGTRTMRIFVLSGSGRASARLALAGFIDLVDDPNVVVIYPDHHAPPKARRSPTGGRSTQPTEIWFRDLVEMDYGIDKLVDVFKLDLLGTR